MITQSNDFRLDLDRPSSESELTERGIAMIEEFLDVPMSESYVEATTTTTRPHQPEDWPGRFSEILNAGQLDAVADLYEHEARFVMASGETLAGREQIRHVLAGLIDAQTRMLSRVVQAVTVDDIAVLYTDFEGTSVDTTGRTVDIQQRAIEVLRRQADGTWRLIVGDPNCRQ